MSFVTPPDPAVGTGGTALWGGTVSDDLQYLAAPWESYTPVWSSTGTAVALVNGTVVGWFKQVGFTVDFSIQLTMGSSTTYGTGTYSLTLPSPQQSSRTQVCQALAFDTSTGNYYRGLVGLFSGGNVRLHFVDGATSTNGWTPTVPFTWASGDAVMVSGRYETTDDAGASTAYGSGLYGVGIYGG